MLIKAEQKNTRQSPRKVRLVADAVRGLPLAKALEQLSVMEKKAADVVTKVLMQGIANAKNNLGLDPANLEIDQIMVNRGPIYRRFRPVSRGRAHAIQKLTCHVRVILRTKEEVKVEEIAKIKEKKEKEAVKSQSNKETKGKKEVSPVSTVKETSAKVVANKASKPTNVARQTKQVGNRTTSK